MSRVKTGLIGAGAGLIILAGAVVPGFADTAAAKIAPASCQTSSGQTPPGQQPVCEGGGLKQQPATNPAGHAPPGQQP